jgi:hypothetical protein
LGHIDSTVEDQARWESALASRGRSNEQWDAWESVYSPVGEDGYPRASGIATRARSIQ